MFVELYSLQHSYSTVKTFKSSQELFVVLFGGYAHISSNIRQDILPAHIAGYAEGSGNFTKYLKRNPKYSYFCKSIYVGAGSEDSVRNRWG